MRHRFFFICRYYYSRHLAIIVGNLSNHLNNYIVDPLEIQQPDN